KGPWLESTSPPFSVSFTSHNERSAGSGLLMCGEAPRAKDQDQKISTGDLTLEDNSRKSPAVTEVMKTAVCEKAKKLEKSTDDGSDERMKTGDGQKVTDTIKNVSVNDQSEHEEAKNTSEDSVKKEHYLVSATINRNIINIFVSWYFYRSLSSVHTKKKAKALPSARPISSQYLGTLKVLEDKHTQNKTEFDKADSLRAAVFQNWLEKKRALLLELKRMEKKKAENLRNDTEKKEAVKREEAIASFEAWKKNKQREAKKLSEKKKLEELSKQKETEQKEDKTEAAQKVICSFLSVTCWSPVLPSHYRNEKKEEYIKQKKVEKILERRKQEKQQENKEEKNKKAMEEYERWL
ncbi:MAP9 protein, partial [Rhynochetos jubatus]|nr:MAP9 protein [Rhynochetos jubatus]